MDELIKHLPYEYPLKQHNEYFEMLPYKEHYIDNSWLLIPTKLLSLIENFILFKKSSGSEVEKKFYRDMKVNDMLVRLFKNRPLSFVGGADSWVLKDNTGGYGNWETIGTDKEAAPLTLANYMSYDEIELSSFLSLSIFTPFINQGARDNSGRSDPNCQPNGIYVGQNGSRFERAQRMEWRYMIVDPEQNTSENGYGPDSVVSCMGSYMSIWANFYGVPYFPLYTEVEEEYNGVHTGRFHKLNTGVFLDTLVYRKRVQILAEVFLKEANYRAKKINKKAFCYVVGLGLGAWKLSSAGDLQTIITINTYLELLRTYNYEHVSDLYFAWFNIPKGAIDIPSELNGIKIHVGHKNPAEPLNDQNKLLVANWPWDPNSYVGNEYWCGQLRTSGDPAAACSSFISYFGNPDLCNITEIHHFNTN